ncbi:hypothetical protein [Spirochaeta lutea]|uniref:Uncharacterized protein n=1 Tax=Spirochaeta lutea TaxID=1480694 RepID=A0A098QS72_9SPIO|nr:hypothetical protein [Spirochaeta lutea]KGE70725.1 hypothetical protein DC28_14570 [Spirochaeta lutea]
MADSEQFYKAEADFLLRENMNKLKGLIDLLGLGVMETMTEQERAEFIKKIQHNMDSLYEKLEASITKPQ